MNHQIYSDIHRVISPSNMVDFSASNLRVRIASGISANSNEAQALRVRIARQLKRLEEQGLLESRIYSRIRVYSKTEAFYKANFELVEWTAPKPRNKYKSQYLSLKKELKYVRVKLKERQSEALEHRKLMQRSEELSEVVRPLFTETTEAMDKLKARTAALDNTIKLLKLRV
ncbi:hypothetical protein AB4382_11680 [Vibrio breoganii]